MRSERENWRWAVGAREIGEFPSRDKLVGIFCAEEIEEEEDYRV